MLTSDGYMADDLAVGESCYGSEVKAGLNQGRAPVRVIDNLVGDRGSEAVGAIEAGRHRVRVLGSHIAILDRQSWRSAR